MMSNKKTLSSRTYNFLDGFKPRPKLTISQWADEYRIVPKVGSPEPGKWSTARTPYLEEIMDCLSPTSPVKKVILMKGTQIGGTEVGNNWLGYIMHLNPAPVLMVQPTVEIARRYSKQRLSPMITETKVLAEKVRDPRERDSGNTILMKEFPGGVLIMGGANSAAALRSMPICFLFTDEIDAYPDDVEGEGDPMDLAVKRTSNFRSSKHFAPSTPTLEGQSRVEKEFKDTDQRYYNVPCPECREFFVIRWKNIIWEKKDFRTAKCQCPKCDYLISEMHKTKMLKNGVWKAENPECKSGAVGFHLSALYSPVGWFSWADAVKEFLAAVGDSIKMKTFVNTVLGETFKEEQKRIDWELIYDRREPYENKIPREVMVLTAAVDVQMDRLELELKGWAHMYENWHIEHQVFQGNPKMPEVWDELDEYLEESQMTADGRILRIAITLIDSGGGATKEVYDFCSTRKDRKIFAIKGASTPDSPIARAPTYTNIGKVPLYHIGTDTAKNSIMGYFQRDHPGPGYCHFPKTITPEYCKQLCAEARKKTYHKGYPVYRWVKTRQRNEAWDLFVYNLAGIMILRVNWKRVYKGHLPEQKTLHKELREVADDIQARENAPVKREVSYLEKKIIERNKNIRNPSRGGGFATNY